MDRKDHEQGKKCAQDWEGNIDLPPHLKEAREEQKCFQLHLFGVY